jgi:hypothetical protein
LEKAIRQIYNVKLPTELLFIEFNTTITQVLLMNYMDILSAGVGHSCEYRTSRRIVNVGVNMSVIRLLYNEHLYTAPSTDRITSTSIIGPSCSTTVTVTVGVDHSPDRSEQHKDFLTVKSPVQQIQVVTEG